MTTTIPAPVLDALRRIRDTAGPTSGPFREASLRTAEWMTGDLAYGDLVDALTAELDAELDGGLIADLIESEA